MSLRLSRREALAAGCGVLSTPVWLTAAESKLHPIVDTHTHFYDPSRPEGVPWPGKTDEFLYRTVLPSEYRRFAEPLGVVGTVVVEASPWVEDNQWILDLADKDAFLLGLVGNLPPGTDDFRKHYNRFAKHPKFLGIRVNSGPLAEGLPKAEFLTDLGKLQETDRELDVNGGPSLLPLVDQLAKTLPDLRIVINHLANVRIDGSTIPADYIRDLKAAASHPRVFMKVSALVEGASQGGRKAPSDPEYYRPILELVWELFGEDRVIYGSNWPVSARFADYQTVQSIMVGYVSGLSSAAQAKFFRGNALAAYKWPA